MTTADDLAYNSVGAFGCRVPGITPNIDKLAEQGFDKFYGFRCNFIDNNMHYFFHGKDFMVSGTTRKRFLSETAISPL
jgi:hypothetical protein